MVGGDDVAAITSAVQRLLQNPMTQSSLPNVASSVVAAESTTTIDDTTTTETTNTNTTAQLEQRLDRLIRSTEVMIFMKGTPDQPRCGFSRQVVEIFQQETIPFGSFDILSDESVRQGLKVYSDWPTYPQIYVHGELIGGLDILKEMKEEGTSLAQQFGIVLATTSTTIENSSGHEPTIDSLPGGGDSNERLKLLINRSPVMLFMKGLPSAPKCGFSREIVEMLELAKISYDAFDILCDETVRQGLKEYSDWPTYPQLYVNGELIGGLDIVKEMNEDGTLKNALMNEGSKHI
jgi:Grx4 family monothiol glutaredoxin